MPGVSPPLGMSKMVLSAPWRKYVYAFNSVSQRGITTCSGLLQASIEPSPLPSPSGRGGKEESPRPRFGGQGQGEGAFLLSQKYAAVFTPSRNKYLSPRCSTTRSGQRLRCCRSPARWCPSIYQGPPETPNPSCDASTVHVPRTRRVPGGLEGGSAIWDQTRF